MRIDELARGCWRREVLVGETNDNFSKALVSSFPTAKVTSETIQKPQENSDNGEENDLQRVCSLRRRSCALVNTPSPCVNKAIHHVQELERKIEGWIQQMEREVSPQTNHSGKIVRFSTTEGNTAPPIITSLVSPGLCIEGKELCVREGGTSTPLNAETGAVLLEVIDLLGRLEADRQEAEEALKKEKERRRALGEKIDRLSLWRLQQLPAAVQKEHEACVRDISELQWHLKFKKERLQHVKDRMTKAEVLNQRLCEDIDFVKKHGPLLKGKLEMESSIMNQIKCAQDEANETLSKAVLDLGNAQQHFEEEQLRAATERNGMAKELDGIADQLKGILKDLQQLKHHWNAYSSKIAEIEEKLTLKEKICEYLLKQIPHLREQEITMNGEAKELRLKIEDQMLKIQQLEEDTSELQRQIQVTRSMGEAEVRQLEQEYNQKRQALLALSEKNRECELETEDFTRHIQQSEQSTVQLQKDRKRMLQKISQNEEQRDRVKEELSQVAAAHNATKAKLEDHEQQIYVEEQRMREVAENMKRQIMSEMKAIAILKGKIASEKTELQQGQTNTEKEKVEIQKAFEDSSSSILELEKEVEEFQRMYNEKKECIENMKKNIQELEVQHKTTAEKLEQKKTTLLHHLRDVENRHAAVSAELTHVLSRIEDLSRKTEEYRVSKCVMEKTARTMPDAIEKLQADFDAVDFKHKTATSIINSLQSEISNCKDRIKLSEETHKSLYKNRRITMEETKAALKKGLRENVDLAQEYKDLQRALLIAKTEAVAVHSEKNRMEASFQDHKQLSLLQRRMHKALEEYFKQRSLYSQAGLATFQALSNENSKKIVAIQEDLSKAIQRISAFLHSLTDDSTTTDNAAPNKHPGSDVVLKHKKKPAVQITV
ncbi:coiled-coil domain-containing protein 178 isoform X2 [Lepisosteus oculatus]|uniref:coiled-coil domain-containing protein 178 isoform X2 n=1 Tax=Lepisosteus oculatus TaxID=7918 RepID=UPI00371C2BF8